MRKENLKSMEKQPHEEFIRQVVFMKDDEKILAVFPFYHNISDHEYEVVVGNFFNDDNSIPEKRDFCLMYETNFGWGWIHNKIVPYLELANRKEYNDFRNMLVTNKVIKETFILNEED